MKNPIHIFKILRSIKLSSQERTVLRNKLSEYAALKPVRISDVGRLNTQKSHTALPLLAFRKIKSMPIIAGLLIATFVGGGTSFAAENALPGDILYPVKTEINESVRGSLAFSGEAKARWEGRMAERRLEEATKLAVSGQLSAEHQAAIEKRFDQHADRTQKRIEVIAESDPALAAELTTRFESALIAHDEILVDLSAQTDGETSVDTSVLSDRIRENVTEFMGIQRTVSDAAVDVRPDSDDRGQMAAKRMIGAAEKSIESATSLLLRAEAKLTKSEYERARAEIARNKEKLESAIKHYRNEEYKQSFLLAQQVHGAMQHLIVFLKAQFEHDSPRPLPYDELDESPSDKPGYEILKPVPAPLPMPIEIDVRGDVEVESSTEGSASTDTKPSDTGSEGSVETDASIKVDTRLDVSL